MELSNSSNDSCLPWKALEAKNAGESWHVLSFKGKNNSCPDSQHPNVIDSTKRVLAKQDKAVPEALVIHWLAKELEIS